MANLTAATCGPPEDLYIIRFKDFKIVMINCEYSYTIVGNALGKQENGCM